MYTKNAPADPGSINMDKKELIKTLEKSIEKGEITLLHYRKRLNHVRDTEAYVVKVNDAYGVAVEKDGTGILCHPSDVSLFNKATAEITAKEIPLKDSKGNPVKAYGEVRADLYFLDTIHDLEQTLKGVRQSISDIKNGKINVV